MLEKTGVSLAIREDRLVVDAPAGLMTFALRDAIVSNKTSLMALLAKRHNNTSQLPLAVAAPASPTPDTRAQWDATLAATITTARAERDADLKRWNEFADALEQLQAMGAMNTPEFDALLIEWENLNRVYKLAENRLECAELTRRIRDESREKVDNY
jgi:hypothetical protein